MSIQKDELYSSLGSSGRETQWDMQQERTIDTILDGPKGRGHRTKSDSKQKGTIANECKDKQV
jgi:hypothetical protein